MKIKTFEKITLAPLRQDIETVIAGVGQKYGISIKVGGCRYSPENATFKLELATIANDGTVATREAKDFTEYAELFGLKPEQLGTTIQFRGESYVVRGLAVKSRRFPVLTQRVSDGKFFKLQVGALTGKTAAA
jgi:hypothetical protein